MSTNGTPPTTDNLRAIHALCDDMVGRMVGYRTTEATVPELEQIKAHAQAMSTENVSLCNYALELERNGVDTGTVRKLRAKHQVAALLGGEA